MHQTIEQRGGELFVAGKDGDHSTNAVRGDDDGPPLIAVGEQIEEQLAADAIERHKAQLVDMSTSTGAAAAAA
jgi:hypothetical protein